MLFSPGGSFRIQLGINQLLQLGSRLQSVFAGDDVKRLLVSVRLAGDNAFGYGRSHELEDTEPHRSGDDVCSCNFLNSLFASGIDRPYALDLYIVTVVVGDMNRVLLSGVDLAEELLHDISKNEFVTCLGENRPDESAAYIARAELNSFHYSSI